MKTKIAYCLPSLCIPGGMERTLTIKANYLADVLDYDIYIILTDGKNEPIFYNLSPKIHVINLDINFDALWGKSFLKKGFIYLKKQSVYKKKLKEVLFKIKPDITVSMLRREINFINSIKDGSIKVGEIHVNKTNFRNFEDDKNNHIIKQSVSKYWMSQLTRNLKKLSAFVVLSNEDKDNWSELNNTVVIGNPLPFYPEESSNCSSKKVVAVGRYVRQKGFDLLINAWKIVSEKHPDWQLNIYGGGNKEPFEMQVKSLDLSNSCFLESSVKNIDDKYIESSIFVLSSRYEGFGMVISEAMACGIPAVSFTCPCGPRDIIDDKKDGLLAKNGDIQDLADKICYMIEHEDERKQMGKQARINIQRFKIEAVANQIKELFDSLLAAR